MEQVAVRHEEYFNQDRYQDYLVPISNVTVKEFTLASGLKFKMAIYSNMGLRQYGFVSKDKLILIRLIKEKYMLVRPVLGINKVYLTTKTPGVWSDYNCTFVKWA